MIMHSLCAQLEPMVCHVGVEQGNLQGPAAGEQLIPAAANQLIPALELHNSPCRTGDNKQLKQCPEHDALVLPAGGNAQDSVGARYAPRMHPHIIWLGYPVAELIILPVVAAQQHLPTADAFQYRWVTMQT